MKPINFKALLGGIINFLSTSPIVFPLTLLAVSVVTYGVFIFSLGFYWDDWPPVLVSHLADKASFWEYYTLDRPFQSWTYYFLFTVCRDSTFAWQLAALVFRWSAGLTLYYSLYTVFPRAKQLLRWAAVLFVVFPGFSDQYVSVVYSTLFLNFTLFGASVLTMLLALKIKRLFWVYFPISLVLTLVHLFTMEYFVGLEALRPVLIFLLLNDSLEKKRGRLLSTLIRWLPYLVLLLLYLYWRVVLYPASVGAGGRDNFPRLFGDLINSPVETFLTLATMVSSDLRFLFITIWTDRLVPAILPLEGVTFWLSLVIGLGASCLVAYLLFKSTHEGEVEPGKKDYTRIFGISLLIVLCGLLPAWSTYRQISLGKWADRYSVPGMFGVVLIITTLLFVFIQKKKLWNLILAIIVGLSISFQIQTANGYRKDFIRQENFYQQLKWRIPGLEPGSVLYLPGIPAIKEADYSFVMGVNLLYSGEGFDTNFEYWLTTPRYYKPQFLLENPDSSIIQSLRTFNFVGYSSKLVSVIMPVTGCLWVVDPYYPIFQTEVAFQAGEKEIPNYAIFSQISNPDVITETGIVDNNLSRIIDFSPQNSWCYFFEKADLAQSKEDWSLAVDLYEESIQLGLVPVEGVEYLPFIKSYIALGDIDSAVNLTELMFNKSYFTKPMMCQFWHDIMTDNVEISQSAIYQIYNSEICPQFFNIN